MDLEPASGRPTRDALVMSGRSSVGLPGAGFKLVVGKNSGSKSADKDIPIHCH